MSRTAAVYNDYMAALGGGERSTLAYALALSRLGYQTEVIGRGPMPADSTIRQRFGDDFSLVKLKQLDGMSRRKDWSVFVNHSFMNFSENIGDIGIYAQMFPFVRLAPADHDKLIRNLCTYDVVACNSSFTRLHTLDRWMLPSSAVCVLYPPIGQGVWETSRTFASQTLLKKPQIVALGRFEPSIHCKNHHLIIDAFMEASRDHLLSDWRLFVFGSTSPSRASRDYFGRCEAMGRQSNGRVVVEQDASHSRVNAVLSESFGYVHGTGLLSRQDQPELCEHFGLAIAEAMAHGCVPLVFERGGIFDILDNSCAFVTFGSIEQLRAAFVVLAKAYHSGSFQPLLANNLKGAARLSHAAFTSQLEQLIGEYGG